MDLLKMRIKEERENLSKYNLSHSVKLHYLFTQLEAKEKTLDDVIDAYLKNPKGEYGGFMIGSKLIGPVFKGRKRLNVVRPNCIVPEYLIGFHTHGMMPESSFSLGDLIAYLTCKDRQLIMVYTSDGSKEELKYWSMRCANSFKQRLKAKTELMIKNGDLSFWEIDSYTQKVIFPQLEKEGLKLIKNAPFADLK